MHGCTVHNRNLSFKFVELCTRGPYVAINSEENTKINFAHRRQEHKLGRILKYLFFLILIGLMGLAGYALFSDLPAPAVEIVKPVETNLSK